MMSSSGTPQRRYSSAIGDHEREARLDDPTPRRRVAGEPVAGKLAFGLAVEGDDGAQVALVGAERSGGAERSFGAHETPPRRGCLPSCPQELHGRCHPASLPTARNHGCRSARSRNLYPRARKRTHALREAQTEQGTCKPCVRWALVSPWSPGASRPACLPGPAPDPLDATRARRAYSSKVSPSYAAREFGKIAFARASLSRTAVSFCIGSW